MVDTGEKLDIRDLILLILSICFLISMLPAISGCHQGEKSIEEQLHIDFNNPYYVRGRPSEVWKYVDSDTSQWTYSAQQVAEKIRDDDIEGALNVLYEDILCTSTNKAEQLFFEASITVFEILFYDPEKVLELYRDADRSGWSEDEKAAADLIVALTYENGDFAGALPPEYYTDEYGPGAVIVELNNLAGLKYEEISEKYEKSNVSVLAKIALSFWYARNGDKEVAIRNIEEIRIEIEQRYPGSVYITPAQQVLAVVYDNFEDYARALEEYYRLLELPNTVNHDPSDPRYGSAHTFAHYRIEEISSMLATGD